MLYFPISASIKTIRLILTENSILAHLSSLCASFNSPNVTISHPSKLCPSMIVSAEVAKALFLLTDKVTVREFWEVEED